MEAKIEREIKVKGFEFEALIMPREFNDYNYFIAYLKDDMGRIILFYSLEGINLIFERAIFRDTQHILTESDIKEISDAVIAYIKTNWSPWKS